MDRYVAVTRNTALSNQESFITYVYMVFWTYCNICMFFGFWINTSFFWTGSCPKHVYESETAVDVWVFWRAFAVQSHIQTHCWLHRGKGRGILPGAKLRGPGPVFLVWNLSLFEFLSGDFSFSSSGGSSAKCTWFVSDSHVKIQIHSDSARIKCQFHRFKLTYLQIQLVTLSICWLKVQHNTNNFMGIQQQLDVNVSFIDSISLPSDSTCHTLYLLAQSATHVTLSAFQTHKTTSIPLMFIHVQNQLMASAAASSVALALLPEHLKATGSFPDTPGAADSVLLASCLTLPYFFVVVGFLF